MIAMTHRLKRPLLYLGATVLLLAVTRVGADYVRAQSAPGFPGGTVVVPYTVVLEETVVGVSGKSKAAPSQTWGVRSDGAFALKMSEGDKAMRQIQLVDGTRIDVHDWKRGRSTIVQSLDKPWLRDPQRNCAAPIGSDSGALQSAPTIETVNGYRAAKIATATGASWFAVDVGCALLRKEIAYKEGGTSLIQVVSLLPGEPPAALFEVPADYREGPPSMFADPPDPTCDAGCLTSRTNRFARLDEEYRRLHRAR